MKFDINEAAILNLTLEKQNASFNRYETLLCSLEANDSELADAISTLLLKIRCVDIDKVYDDRMNKKICSFPQYEVATSTLQ